MSYNIYYVTCSFLLSLVSCFFFLLFFRILRKFIPDFQVTTVFSPCAVRSLYWHFLPEIPLHFQEIFHTFFRSISTSYLFFCPFTHLTMLNYSRHESSQKKQRTIVIITPPFFSSHVALFYKKCHSHLLLIFLIQFCSLSLSPLYKWDPMTCRSFLGTCPSSLLLIVRGE